MGRVVVAVIVAAVAIMWGGCVVSPEGGPSYGGWTRIEDTGLPGWWYDTGMVDPPGRGDAGEGVDTRLDGPLDTGAGKVDRGNEVDADGGGDAGTDTEPAPDAALPNPDTSPPPVEDANPADTDTPDPPCDIHCSYADEPFDLSWTLLCEGRERTAACDPWIMDDHGRRAGLTCEFRFTATGRSYVIAMTITYDREGHGSAVFLVRRGTREEPGAEVGVCRAG